MKKIAFLLLFVSYNLIAQTKSPNSVSKINLVGRYLSMTVDSSNNSNFLRFETGFLTSNQRNSLEATCSRKLVPNQKYIILAYTDRRIADFTLSIKKDGAIIKSVNEKKREGSNQNPNEFSEIEAIKDFYVSAEGEYTFEITAPLNEVSRAGRYGIVVIVTQDKSETTPNTATDIRKTIDATGLPYTVAQNGDFKLTVQTESGRKQVVTVSSKTQSFEGIEIREIWSPIQEIDSKSALSFTNGFGLLRKNGDLKMGAWQIAGDKPPYIVNFSLTTGAQTPASELKKMIELVAQQADLKEKEIVGSDRN